MTMHPAVTFFIVLLACSCRHQDTAPNNNIGAITSVQVAREALAKGINLENWFNDYSDPAKFSTRFTPAVLRQIKNTGFTCVRLPISSKWLFNEAQPSTLNDANLLQIDLGVKNSIDAGLAVVLDPIHNSNNDTDVYLSTKAGYADKIAAYWGAVAKYFSKYPTDKLFFEVYNEPHASAISSIHVSKSWWWPVQLKLVQSIRAQTINHHVICGSEGWNGRLDLISNTPYEEKNIIYNFHTYDPFLFTHQGATWVGWRPAVEARKVPYPSTQHIIDSLISVTPYQDLKDALKWYGSQKYNLDSMINWMKPVKAWANKNNVLVICNEFGSYKLYSAQTSRVNWIHDMRTALELNGIPWIMWEYDNGFGIVNYVNNDRSQPVVDLRVTHALGLN